MGDLLSRHDLIAIRHRHDRRAARVGHAYRPLRVELRENLLSALAEGRDPWPGIHGFDTTVIPQLERALLAGHDVVLLGERGQGKTRLLRSIGGLLDEWSPVIAGSELGEHPFDPVTPASVRRASELGDDLPVAWRHRSERYVEKLATPDTSVADLIGDVDPIRVAEGARSATRRRSTTGSSGAATAVSSPSTNCPTSPSASRCRC